MRLPSSRTPGPRAASPKSSSPVGGCDRSSGEIRRTRVISRVLLPALGRGPAGGGNPFCRLGQDHLTGIRIAPNLKRPTRDSNGAGDPLVPAWPCSGCGLPCDSCCQKPGALLPHPFTLACAPAHHNQWAIGGLLSAALSVASRRPGVTRHPALRSSDFPPMADPSDSSRVSTGDPSARPPELGCNLTR